MIHYPDRGMTPSAPPSFLDVGGSYRDFVAKSESFNIFVGR